MYSAIVLDVFSRRIVGWAMQKHLRTELVLSAIEQAFSQRCPREVIHHSDHGCQYTSIAFGKRCEVLGVRPSMGSIGDCFDNAMAESFFASLECELLDRRHFKTHTEAKTAVFEYIEGFYNPHRLHSSLGYLSPINFERRYTTTNRPTLRLTTVHGNGGKSRSLTSALAGELANLASLPMRQWGRTDGGASCGRGGKASSTLAPPADAGEGIDSTAVSSPLMTKHYISSFHTKGARPSPAAGI